MKVTKLIREYVEEQVSKAYDAKENPYSKQAAIDRETIKVFEEELRAAQQDRINEFLVKLPLFSSYSRELTDRRAACPSFSYDYSQSMLAERDWARENDKQKKAKIKEIMLALELGANRKELEDMIAKLLEEDG